MPPAGRSGTRLSGVSILSSSPSFVLAARAAGVVPGPGMYVPLEARGVVVIADAALVAILPDRAVEQRVGLGALGADADAAAIGQRNVLRRDAVGAINERIAAAGPLAAVTATTRERKEPEQAKQLLGPARSSGSRVHRPSS